MGKHGNHNENEADHHLYEIRDRRGNDVYKYGICGRPLNRDGSSPRANEQVSVLNLAMRWACFFAKVILTGIPGRARALEIEDEHIAVYEKDFGSRPPGNA
jgi:hypothetical protein